MNVASKCQWYTVSLPNPNSLRDVFFAPREVVLSDGTIAEKMQRWLIDTGSFCTRYGNSLSSRQAASPFILNKNSCEDFDQIFLVQSFSGVILYFIATSMTLRFIELFSQSIKNSLNFADLNSKTKALVNFSTILAMYGFALYLGYAWLDLLLFMVVPIVFEKVLSFKYSNYFKQIYALSSTKNFDSRNFIFKNIQAACIRLLPTILLYVYRYDLFFSDRMPGTLILCQHYLGGFDKQDLYIQDFTRNSNTAVEILLEPLGFILGKIIFDLMYILILKTVSKDADLRDPLGWMFSNFRKQKLPLHKPMLKVQQDGNPQRKKPLASTSFNKQATTSIPTESTSNETSAIENKKREYSKNKANTKEKSNIKSEIKLTANQKIITEVNIEVDGWVRTFQKIENSAFNKEVWGVIIANSVEKQTLRIFEKSLSNGSKESIRQLTNLKDCFEIGPKTIDPRLIGKMYNAGVYQSLQNFMRMEDALLVSQELESHGIQDDVSLIVFSKEAKKHDDITRVARSL